ncbi:MAG: type VI secretion system ImpA family N-terminal domain-containing protein [Polyangia bacterium]
MSGFERSLPGVDVEALLAPISAAQPTGANLRQLPRSVYLEIERLIDGTSVPAIVTTDATGRQSTLRDESALIRSNQDGLARALRCLAEDSKDLDVAALAVRGLLATHGYDGLWCGLYVVRELHERFWDGLYPKPPAKAQTHDEFDEPLPQPVPEPAALSERRVISARASAVEKMEHAVRSALRLTRLFVADDGTACRIADWDGAWAADAERSVADLNALAASQPSEVFTALDESLSGCIREGERLALVLQPLYVRPEVPELGLKEAEAPPVRSLVKELQDCRGFVVQLREQLGKKPVTSDKAKTQPTRAGQEAAPAAALTQEIAAGRYQPRDRAEAIAMIQSAGQFLQRHEPVSPLPRLIFRLVQWARGDSLRPWLDDMFRTATDEQELVLLQLALDAETKLASERLPSGSPVPKDRGDALAMLRDAADRLRAHEPLSPLPYHLEQLLALASGGSPRPWLSQVFAPESKTLARIRSVLGLASQPAADGQAAES